MLLFLFPFHRDDWSRTCNLILCLCAMMTTMTMTLDLAAGMDRSTLTLKHDQVIKFNSTDIELTGLYNTLHWVQKGERSTSKAYTLWDEADVYLLEWPGNITKLDPEWPLLKWTKRRAKYLENRCCQYFVGIEMRAYAYRYLHLTWGPHRLTRTSSPPLTIPGNLLSNLSSQSETSGRTEVAIADFAFVADALLIAVYDEAAIIRVYGLQLAYAKMSREPWYPLKYSLSQGITNRVNKIITQYCCLQSEVCPSGETVVAYEEYSSNFRIFVSSDSGMNFKTLLPKVPRTSLLLYFVLSYPDTKKVIVAHGSKTTATLDSYSMSTGTLISTRKSAHGEIQLNGIEGTLHATRIGEEMSVIIWDRCKVWYSLAEGKNMTKAVLYIHGFIYNNKNLNSSENYIVPRWCKFGPNTLFAYDNSGKLALLDSKNNFFIGADTKSLIFQLIALKPDLTLIPEKHQLSVVPNFDHNQHPKVNYPPRFLQVPATSMLGANYSKRLGMRLLAKTVFPSEFITSFYEENAHLPKKFNNFALRPCQTSSLSVNGSISQKPKVYTMSTSVAVNFTITFKSQSEVKGQLHYEPTDLRKYFRIRMRLVSLIGTDDDQYVFSYAVEVHYQRLIVRRRIFLINFFTEKAIRCNVQPSNQIYIRIEDNPTPTPSMSIIYVPKEEPEPLCDGKRKIGEDGGRFMKVTPCSSCQKKSCSADADTQSYQHPPSKWIPQVTVNAELGLVSGQK